MHRRLALTSSVSAADDIRLPNWAGFCIRGGIVKHRPDEKLVGIRSTFGSLTIRMDQYYVLNDRHVVSYSSRLHSSLSPREGVAALPYTEIFLPN